MSKHLAICMGLYGPEPVVYKKFKKRCLTDENLDEILIDLDKLRDRILFKTFCELGIVINLSRSNLSIESVKSINRKLLSMNFSTAGVKLRPNKRSELTPLI